MPIIYGGFGVMIAVISFNQRYYSTFRDAYSERVFARVNKSTPTDAYVDRYSESNLLSLRDYYRRNRDFTYILAGALYVLNILDAYVDAELFKFDVSDDLSLRGSPTLINYSGNMNTAGLRITLDIK